MFNYNPVFDTSMYLIYYLIFIQLIEVPLSVTFNYNEIKLFHVDPVRDIFTQLIFVFSQ